jgi:ribonucleotide monophosphatase NagD (HAD superfamily)
MAATVLERLGTQAEATMLVGDRIETDVRMARDAGMIATLVLSGATTVEAASRSALRPDLILASVAELLPRVSMGGGGSPKPAD